MEADHDTASTELATTSTTTNSEEPLSKNARKRLLKMEQKDERKAKRKEEKKFRKELRASRGDVDEALTTTPAIATTNAPRPLAERREAAWEMWRGFGSPRLVLAPMVNQSELAFRLLARQHGAGLTYTPMIHASQFVASEVYRHDNFDEHASDRPLVVQFCGDEPHTLLAAARHVASRCDAIDLNCGCPQAIARRGHYGAFLLDEPHLIEEIVRTLSSGLPVPVFVKMRLLPNADGTGVDVPRTIQLAQRLEAAGASLLTIHGRTRQQKCACAADWAAIRTVKASLGIPIIANGGVERPEDLDACLEATACEAVMTSEAALENPAVFSGQAISRKGQAMLTRQYIHYARLHPPRAIAILKAHLFKLLYMALQEVSNRDLREGLGAALVMEKVFDVALEACEREEAKCEVSPEEMEVRCDCEDAAWTTWYRRHRSGVAADPNRYGGTTLEAERDAGPPASEACCTE